MSPPPLIDTHCHLVLLHERGLLEQALEGAAAAGVIHMVTIGVDLRDSERNCAIAEQHENVSFAVGWDPQQLRPPDAAELRDLAALLRHPKAVAVGETGLDTFFRPGYHETPLEIQRESFRIMLELAHDQAKPVVVHDREAHDEVLDVIATVPGSRGVMHCFTGDVAHAQRCLAAGFVISFAGIVTFKNAAPIQRAARELPSGTHVLETDSPFLAPVPHRGTTNLPERVADTAEAVARLRAVSPESVRADTTETAQRLFGLAIKPSPC